MAIFRSCEDIKQLVGAGGGLVGQEPLRHVPAIRRPDLEHFLRQRCEFGARRNEYIEGILLVKYGQTAVLLILAGSDGGDSAVQTLLSFAASRA